MEPTLSRRELLAVLPAAFLLTRSLAHAADQSRTVIAYKLDLSVLFNLISLSLTGTVAQEIDRRAGRYR